MNMNNTQTSNAAGPACFTAMYIGTQARASCIHLFVFLVLEPVSLNFSCSVTLSSRKQIKSQGGRAALTTLEYNNGCCALKNSCRHTLEPVYISALVLAHSDGLVLVYFVTVQIRWNPFGRDECLNTCVRGLMPVRADAASHPAATLSTLHSISPSVWHFSCPLPRLSG